MSNPPPKTPVFGGMLRKTGISPYIWWFWVLLGGLRVVCALYGAVWLVMGGYGYGYGHNNAVFMEKMVNAGSLKNGNEYVYYYMANTNSIVATVNNDVR